MKTKEALSTKRLSINFRTAEYALDENAKQLIDLQFIPISKAFSNARIRIEGNTDNVGSVATNITLSEKRAHSVADYLIQEHGMPANRLIIIWHLQKEILRGLYHSSVCTRKVRKEHKEGKPT